MDRGIVGGVEGGATHSTLVLLNPEGNIISKVKGPGTNHLLVGMLEVRKRIAEMVIRAKEEARISKDLPLAALGLSLSGCESEETNQELVRGFLEAYPTLSERYSIGSDTQGSISATSNNGGIVCIAGTGSNTLLINPDGSKTQCGGWGYLLGDEGSAWFVSYRAVKICFDEMDNFAQAPHSIERIYALIKEHFQVEERTSLLDYFYTSFDKAFISALCRKIAALANEGDPLSILLFREAGRDIARALASIIPKASAELVDADGGLHVVCVGSVWQSWHLLQPGFVPYLDENSTIAELSLMRLTTTMAVGAAYMAADQLNINLKRTYDKNYEIFFHFIRNSCNSTSNHI